MCFRWYVNRCARFRVIQDITKVEAEKVQLLIDLKTGTTQKAKRDEEKQRQAELIQKEEKQKTLTDHMDAFYADVATESVRQAKLLRQRLSRLFEETGVKTLADISAAKFRTAIGRMRCFPQSPKKKPSEYPLLSDASRRYYVKAAKQFCRWIDDENIAKNPLKKWKSKKRAKPIERFARDRLQPTELHTLIHSVNASNRIVQGYDSPTRTWIYIVSSMTGLRRGEISTLTPKSFDLVARKVFVRSADTKNKQEADLPLPAKMVEDLKVWLAGKRGVLFPGLAKKDTAKMLKRDLELAGLVYQTEKGCRCFHALRNTFISSLFDQGLPLAVIQRKARHSDIRMTLKYGKPKDDEASFVELMDYPGLT